MYGTALGSKETIGSLKHLVLPDETEGKVLCVTKNGAFYYKDPHAPDRELGYSRIAIDGQHNAKLE